MEDRIHTNAPTFLISASRLEVKSARWISPRISQRTLLFSPPSGSGPDCLISPRISNDLTDLAG
jgi:hypothetical protein